ncbi:hypothetical protein [Deinococcus knuensis]|uniref:Uncharacterized protein n=1 Tax=Deinococcus knuensis TaxID=1837380 RepID=A0ABQ2SKI0_9DEIO|nr:hypothetical protein [Deinococcus knuensis]GGS28462.1 hypothetical protein GCM10008961_20120 [Deinococcus knuensis]
MIHASSPPPTATEVTSTAPDRPAALDALLTTALHTLAQQTAPADPTLAARIPTHLLQVTRVLHDAPGPDGHTIRAQVALPYGVLERAALHARPDLTLTPLHLTGTPGAARQALGRALTDIGFTVTSLPQPGAPTLRCEGSAQARNAPGDTTCVAAAHLHLTLNGQPVVTRTAAGSGPTPQTAASAALTHAANLCAHPLVLTLLETP